MAIVTEIRFNKLPELIGLARERAAAAVQRTANKIEEEAKANIVNNNSVDTGNLLASIQAEEESELTWLVGSRDVEYAPHVEYGTVAHVIRPRTAGALFWKGAAHPVKLVHHPGTRAKPFMRPAAERIRPQFIAAMKQIAEM